MIQLSDDTYASLLSVMADIQYLKVTYTMLIKEGELIFQELVFKTTKHTYNPGQKYWRENGKKHLHFPVIQNKIQDVE